MTLRAISFRAQVLREEAGEGDPLARSPRKAGKQRQKLSAQQTIELLHIFELLDVDHSSTIRVHDLVGAMSLLRMASLKDELQAAMARLGMGQSDRIDFSSFVRLWSDHRLSIEVEQGSELAALEEIRRPSVLDCLPAIVRAVEAHAAVDKVIGAAPRPRKPKRQVGAAHVLPHADEAGPGAARPAGCGGGEAASPRAGQKSSEWVQECLDETQRMLGEYFRLRDECCARRPRARRRARALSQSTVGVSLSSQGVEAPSGWLPPIRVIRSPPVRAKAPHGATRFPCLTIDPPAAAPRNLGRELVGNSLGRDRLGQAESNSASTYTHSPPPLHAPASPASPSPNSPSPLRIRASPASIYEASLGCFLPPALRTVAEEEFVLSLPAPILETGAPGTGGAEVPGARRAENRPRFALKPHPSGKAAGEQQQHGGAYVAGA